MSTMLALPEAFAGRISKRGDPTWEVAGLFPLQGEWTEQEFLSFSTDKFVELNDGCLEVLPMPSVLHQRIVRMLLIILERFVSHHQLGEAFCAPLPIRLWEGQYREPDIVYFNRARIAKLEERGMDSQPEGADLVMEVVSPGDMSRRRDLVEKREIYARAQISEYWIIDPEKCTITVLALEGAAYRVHGEFSREQRASSVLLGGFEVDVKSVFAAAE